MKTFLKQQKLMKRKLKKYFNIYIYIYKTTSLYKKNKLKTLKIFFKQKKLIKIKLIKYFQNNLNFKNYLPKIASIALPIFLGVAVITFASTVGTDIATQDISARDISATRNFTTAGNAEITGTLDLTGLATFLVGLNVTGDSTFHDDLTIAGTIQGNMNGRNYLDLWDAKISKLAGGSTADKATILVLADSWGAQSPSLYDFVARRLWDEYGNAGCGFMISTASNQLYGCSVASAGTWTTNINSSLNGAIVASSRTSTHSATESLTFTGPATDIVIHYVEKSGGGSFTWNLNGAGDNTVSTSAGSSAMVFHAPAGLSNLTDGQQSLVIEVTSGTVEIVGVEFNRNKAGIRMHRAGQGSATASAIASSNQTEWQDSVAQLNPDLVTISFGLNDYSGSSEAQYKANLQTIVTRILTAVPDASIVIMSQGDGQTIDLSASSKNYIRAMEEVARENNIGFINYKEVIGTWAEANARGLYADTLHLNNYGKSVFATALLDYLDRDDWIKIPTISKNYSFGDDNMTEALNSATYNLAIGNDIMRNVSSDQNIGIGYGSLEDLTTGPANTAVGFLSAANTTTGGYNTAMGWYALGSGVVTGASNTCLGSVACQYTTTGYSNTGVGSNALTNLTTGYANTALGSSAGIALVEGNSNVSIGFNALGDETSGNGNTCVGTNACYTQVGKGANVAVGMNALPNSGGLNTSLGYYSMNSATTAGWSTAVGYEALKSVTSAYRNVGLGLQAGYLTTGADSVFIGSRSGYALTTGNRNVIIGRDTCYQTNTESAGKCGGVSNTASDVFAVDSNNVDSPLLFGSFADGSEYLTINGKQTNAPQTTTLSSTALAVTRNVVYLTCSGNALATITGGITGQIITIKFADACTVTNNDAAGANTIDMSTFLTFAAKDTLQLLFDGTSWYEVGHSDNT